ncbi:GH3 auxin-responsive promoter family protein [Bdellovibrionota bacterium FG-2]
MFTRILVLGSTWLKYRAFVRDTQDPIKAKTRVWKETWNEIRDAPYWRQRFPASHPGSKLEDFELTSFEDYREALDESFQGELSKISGKKILFWSESSATSGRRKLFPITPLYREQFQRTTAPLLHSFAREFTGFLGKPVLYFAGMLPSERSPAGIDMGFISNFNYRHIPKALQKHYAFPLEVFRNWETFSNWAGLYAVAGDLSAMIGISPSVIEIFAENLERRIEEFWPYLEGTRQPPAPFPPIQCGPARLALLKKAFAKKPFSFREVWPSLQFVCCWKTAGCSMQLPKLERYLGGVPTVDATYSATEGWVNVPLNPRSVGGPIHPGAHIFEFLKVVGAFADAPAAVPRKEDLKQCWELEIGASYEIVLTTAMGLIRYRLGDFVKCTGYFNRTAVIEFTQKGNNEVRLGLTGISEAQLIEAMKKTDFAVSGRWIFGPNKEGDRLVFYCEKVTSAIQAAIPKIHDALLAMNRYYARDITRGLLKSVEIQELPAGHAIFGVLVHSQSKPKILALNPPGEF